MQTGQLSGVNDIRWNDNNRVIEEEEAIDVVDCIQQQRMYNLFE
jgi:hypothetical protein